MSVARRALSSSLTRGTMYNWRVKAIVNALEKAGRATGTLQLDNLTALGHLDQYHYLGTQACDHVIELLGIQADASVLDIGAGIGGPARYLSAHTGCRVVGVELQAELAEAAADLTARVEGVADRVTFVTGDFSDDACTLPEVRSRSGRPRNRSASSTVILARVSGCGRQSLTTLSPCSSFCTSRTVRRCSAVATITCGRVALL